MKQHITLKQIQSLSPKAAIKLRAWFQERLPYIYKEEEEILELKNEGKPLEDQPRFLYTYKGDQSFFGLPYMTIGQMIEFLDFGNDFSIEYEESNDSWRIYWGLPKKQYKSGNPYGDSELCDSLWEACREILDK